MNKATIIVFTFLYFFLYRCHSQIYYPKINFDPVNYFENKVNDADNYKEYFIQGTNCIDTMLYEFCVLEKNKKTLYSYSLENDTHVTGKTIYFYNDYFRIDSLYYKRSTMEYAFKYSYLMNKVIVKNYTGNEFSSYDEHDYKSNILVCSTTYKPDSQLSATIYYSYNKKKIVKAKSTENIMLHEFTIDTTANYIIIKKYSAESPAKIIEESQYVFKDNQLKYTTSKYSNLLLLMSTFIYEDKRLIKRVDSNSNGGVNEFIYKYQND